MSGQSKAVVTVIGFDRKGIIARVSNVFGELQDRLNGLAGEMGVQIRIQKSEIFEAMHQI